MSNDSSRISRHEISTQIFQWYSHIFLLNVISVMCRVSNLQMEYQLFTWRHPFIRDEVYGSEVTVSSKERRQRAHDNSKWSPRRDDDQFMMTWSERHIESSDKFRWIRCHRFHTLQETFQNLLPWKMLYLNSENRFPNIERICKQLNFIEILS